MQGLTEKERKWNEQMNLWRIQKLLPAPPLPAPITMDVTYSREYLRGIPEQRRQKRKQDLIAGLFHQVVRNVTAAATNEKTSYMIDEQVYAQYEVPIKHRGDPNMEIYLLDIILSKDDIIGALQGKFPDCVISFQEAWIDTAHNTRVLKKGILIDWS
jgi:hypothetical protein